MESNPHIIELIKLSDDSRNAPVYSVDDISIQRFYENILCRISKLLVQMVAVIRNFSLDNNGRSQLLSSGKMIL